MADTLTPNYGWVKPEVAGSAATWGAKQNGVFDQIDAQVKANEIAGSNIGDVKMFAGPTAPTNWLICDGRSLDTTTYAKLFAVLQYTWGGSGANFNIPNLVNKFPLGAGPNPLGTMAGGGATGTFAYTISTANLPLHTHPITQVAHGHTASQPAHVHPDPGHTHGVSASQDPHSHGLDHVPLTSVAGGNAAPGGGWGLNTTRTDTQQPAVHVAISGAVTGLQAAGGDAVTVNPTTPTGPTATGNAGSGTPLSIVPVFAALNFVIRYQ
jgi:microcystin-dependent protein